MKLITLFLSLVFTNFWISTQVYAQGQISSIDDIKIIIEDNVNIGSDVDLNDVIMCASFRAKSNAGDNITNALSISLSSVGAGAEFLNALYLRSPCEGEGVVEVKRPEDSCSVETTLTNVNVKGELVEITSSFTKNGFSSQCTKDSLINVFSVGEVCKPKKFFINVTCETFPINSGFNLKIEELFHVDPDGPGPKSGIDSDSFHNGLTNVVLMECTDPTPEEYSNGLVSLKADDVLGSPDCDNDSDLCRAAITNKLNTNRATGWENIVGLKQVILPNGHNMDFSPRPFIAGNLFEPDPNDASRYLSPIWSDENDCENDNGGGPGGGSIITYPPTSVLFPASTLNQFYSRDFGKKTMVDGFERAQGVLYFGPASSITFAEALFQDLGVFNIYTADQDSGPNAKLTKCVKPTPCNSGYALIESDTFLGTSDFCVSVENRLVTVSSDLTNVGTELLNTCTNESAHMITFREYNAMIRHFEETPAMWSSGIVGQGYVKGDVGAIGDDAIRFKANLNPASGKLLNKSGEEIHHPFRHPSSTQHLWPFFVDLVDDDVVTDGDGNSVPVFSVLQNDVTPHPLNGNAINCYEVGDGNSITFRYNFDSNNSIIGAIKSNQSTNTVFQNYVYDPSDDTYGGLSERNELFYTPGSQAGDIGENCPLIQFINTYPLHRPWN